MCDRYLDISAIKKNLIEMYLADMEAYTCDRITEVTSLYGYSRKNEREVLEWLQRYLTMRSWLPLEFPPHVHGLLQFKALTDLRLHKL